MLAATLAAAVVGAGCGGDGPDEAAIGAAASPTQSASVTWAVADSPEILDPLYARTRTDRLAARQVYEPLVAQLGGPFDFSRVRPGLALSLQPSADRTVWRARLRSGVRFHGGEPFNAAAVLANVDRWLAVPEGREQLGELLADAPRPGLVRFILPAPDPRFDRRLASPRLGIVSPLALEAAAGAPLSANREPANGTGAFELREGDDDRLLLARNTGWWGSDRGLGPGVDQIELRAVADPEERLGLLGDGLVRAAELEPAQLDEVTADPLLTVVRNGGEALTGIERSVRGIPAGEPAPSLNAVWVTGIDRG